jgi:hypothetical protein
MSTLYPIIEINYANRKPSKAVIMRTIAEYLKQGGKSFEISWGENRIDLQWHDGHNNWYGYGWIKELGGDNIAQELNDIRKQAIAEIKQFKEEHFQFIHIGDKINHEMECGK